jgi:hypothetical protein
MDSKQKNVSATKASSAPDVVDDKSDGAPRKRKARRREQRDGDFEDRPLDRTAGLKLVLLFLLPLLALFAWAGWSG